MNRKFLEKIWINALNKGFELASSGRPDTPCLQLPYLDEAQEIIGFIDEMGLKSVQKMTDSLTEEDAAWLLSKYPKDMIMEVLCGMENYKGLNRKYKSAKLTCNNWCKKRLRDSRANGGTNRNIPVT